MPQIETIAPELIRGEDGVWRAARESEISYPEHAHRNTARVEDTSFWYRHRNECITALIHEFPPRQEGAVFDIGGGNGCVTRAIAARGVPAVLVEPQPDGVRNARERGLEHVICSSFQEAGFAPSSLPAVGLFDVIEHIEDDLAFLRAIRESLEPRGRLYLTVPAYRWLWSDKDDRAGHFRRYTLGQVTRTLTQTGFAVDFASYIFRFLPLPMLLFRTLPTRLGVRRKVTSARVVARNHAAGGGGRGLLGRIATSLLRAEAGRIFRRSPMRFGGSCLVAATRTG